MIKHLTIRLFGVISIELGGVPVTGLGTRKADALLVYLVSQKRPFPREVLADLLWDDRPQDQALANLRSLLSGLKKQLKPFLIITRYTIGFNHDSDYWLDTEEFTELLKIEDQRLKLDTQSSIFNLQSLQTAADLYRGDFLDGFNLRDARAFEEWSSLERERLRHMAENALQKLARTHLEQGNYANGNQVADQLLKLNNLSERANRYKMLLLARSGQRNAALKQYESYCQLLDEELGVIPAAETTAVYERIRASQTIKLHNLPPQATPFVGRSQELAYFQQHLIDPSCRLLTLLGPGGMGKTRLALATAERIVQQKPGLFLNGIRFVPLSAVRTPNLLITAVADACDISLQGQESPLQQVIASLRDKEMLLLLDNIEHLFGEGVASPDAVDILLELLQQAPMLQILITSRERLHIQEEWVFDLGGLAYPADSDEQNITAVDLATYSALQLFQQNALRTQRQFMPTDVDWAAMAQVCRLLEGMPLGIELASAWTRDFSCPEIAQQIQTDVDFLTTKLRNVPPRHRSLTAVFDYSWALLSGEEQAVFARLSLFRGSFSGEAAAAIAQATPDMLTGFCGKSLLRRLENGGTGQGENASTEPGRSDRYDLHEFLRQYAADKLAQNAEAAEKTAVRYMTVYLELLAAQERLNKPETRQLIQTDLPHIRQAWQEAARRYADSDRAESGHAIGLLESSMTVLHDYFSIQSKFQEGIDLFRFALNQLTQADNREQELTAVATAVICEMRGRKARLHIHIGQLEEARQELDEAMALLPFVEDLERHGVILSYSAITTFYAGDFVRAAEMMTAALHLAESVGDERGIALAHNFLGSCAKAQGDYEAAEAEFSQAIVHYQQDKDELGAAMALNNLGNVAQARGDFATAQAHYLACSDLFKALDHSHGAATTLANAGRLALKQGQYDEARKLLTESVALKRAQKDDRGTAVALIGLGGVSLATGSYEQAAAELMQAIRLSQSCGDLKLTLEGLAVLAALATKRGLPQEAATVLFFILTHKGTAQEVRDNAETFLGEVKAILSEVELAAGQVAGENMNLETAVSLIHA